MLTEEQTMKKTDNHDVETLLATRDLLDAYQAYRVYHIQPYSFIINT